MQAVLENANFTLPHIIISLCVIGVAFVLWRIFTRIYKHQVRQQEEAGKGRPNSLFYNMARAVIVILVILAVLQINDINVTSLVAGLGVASAIVGLALQDYLKDVINGAKIVRDNFFKEGDVVRYGDIEGTVVEFNMRSTKISRLDNLDLMTISNRNISEIGVVPESQFQDVDLGLPYEDDPKLIREVMTKAVERILEVEGIDDCKLIGIPRFEDSSIVYRVRFFCQPAKKYGLRPIVNEIILEELTKANVSIPYPQLDVHMNS